MMLQLMYVNQQQKIIDECKGLLTQCQKIMRMNAPNDQIQYLKFCIGKRKLDVSRLRKQIESQVNKNSKIQSLVKAKKVLENDISNELSISDIQNQQQKKIRNFLNSLKNQMYVIDSKCDNFTIQIDQINQTKQRNQKNQTIYQEYSQLIHMVSKMKQQMVRQLQQKLVNLSNRSNLIIKQRFKISQLDQQLEKLSNNILVQQKMIEMFTRKNYFYQNFQDKNRLEQYEALDFFQENHSGITKMPDVSIMNSFQIEKIRNTKRYSEFHGDTSGKIYNKKRISNQQIFFDNRYQNRSADILKHSRPTQTTQTLMRSSMCQRMKRLQKNIRIRTRDSYKQQMEEIQKTAENKKQTYFFNKSQDDTILKIYEKLKNRPKRHSNIEVIKVMRKGQNKKRRVGMREEIQPE